MRNMKCSSLSFELQNGHTATMSIGENPNQCGIRISVVESSQYFYDMNEDSHDTLSMAFLCHNCFLKSKRLESSLEN
jgi:hypothetical protein